MKRSVFFITLVMLLIPVLAFSSCMNVNITLPEGETGAVINTPATTQAPVETLPPVETTVPAENTTASQYESTTAPEQTTAAAPATPLEMNDGELLNWFNTALNNVKEGMPAFERAKLTTVTDIELSNQMANSLVSFVKGALLSEETEVKTANKGSSCIEIMSPDGERYVSQLLESDIKDITITAKGTSYEVTVTLPDAVNPTRDSGAYAKVFNFITVDDVIKVYAPKVGATVEKKNIKVTYSNCYAKAVISPDGRVEAYETYVTCVISLLDATVQKVVTINTDVDITLVSTTKYSKFVY